ncbi:hypothetical protein ACFO5R_13655 [Halosolutus amylolyticus]|uniref:ABC transporter permease n=1 Tax=Halosolutus amylolyticus TaxID=2932267 RepID=A0ABD5PR79_9EURY|nr:hypothetical protein [Halosolutus amylolyticus]
MSIEPLAEGAAAVRSAWTALERDWRSVVVGAVIVAVVQVLNLGIPW